MLHSNLQYLHRRQVDTAKWDQCIDNATNGLVYARSFYLDNMAKQWDALVLGDYEAVMPLPWNQKLGNRYIYTPPFTQRVGIFGNHLSQQLIQAFYQTAEKHFRFMDIMTDVSYSAKYWTCRKERKNFIIPLSRPYAEIKQSYSTACIKNIKKAVNRGCRFTTAVTIEQVIQLYRSTYEKLADQGGNENFERLTKLAHYARSNNLLYLCGVVDEKEHLLQGSILFHCKKRLYYLIGAPTGEGRKARATYFLIDQLLQQFCETSLLFDFEGSDIPDVAAFYNQFGPQEETYFHLIYNRLPLFLRWLKNPNRI